MMNPAPHRNEDRRVEEKPVHTKPIAIGFVGVIFIVVLVVLLTGEGANFYDLPAVVSMVLMACGGVALVIASLCWIAVDIHFRHDIQTAKVAEMNGRLEVVEKELAKLRCDVRQTNALLRQLLRVVTAGDQPRATGRVRMGGHLREVGDDTDLLPTVPVGLDAEVIRLGRRISDKIGSGASSAEPS
jgi:hypothetical protein